MNHFPTLENSTSMENKMELDYLIRFKVVISEDRNKKPYIIIKLGNDHIYVNDVEKSPPEIKRIINTCLAYDMKRVKELIELTDNILPDNT